MAIEFEKQLSVQKTNIPGVLVFDLSVHGDNRGWFKENWQRAKMTALGLPDFGPVQNNISYNTRRGVTRGIHAEPWDKFISIAKGSVFGAWVDLRPGESFGQVFTTVLDPSKAIYIPRGVGNSFQTLEDDTVYTYLVNAHWSLGQKKTYTFVNLTDPSLGIDWPIPQDEWIRSEADLHHPLLKDAGRRSPRRTLVVGWATASSAAACMSMPTRTTCRTEHHDIDTMDISIPPRSRASTGICTAPSSTARRLPRWACWRRRPRAGASPGRPTCRAANLARVATEHRLTLVHVSSDYVFDGTAEQHTEIEDFALRWAVAGQTKAAADRLVGNVPRHYILRSSLLGDRQGPQLRQDR